MVTVEQLGKAEQAKVKNGHYFPTKGEPSPFGPVIQEDILHPWLIWKASRKAEDEQWPSTGEGVAAVLDYERDHDMLKQFLLEEQPRTQVDLQDSFDDLITPCGSPSLGYVIGLHWCFAYSWQDTHNRALEQIERVKRIEAAKVRPLS